MIGHSGQIRPVQGIPCHPIGLHLVIGRTEYPAVTVLGGFAGEFGLRLEVGRIQQSAEK